MKGWLNFGALMGYPLCAIVWLHFLIQILIRKPVLFWWHFFQKLKNIIFVHSKFHLMFFIFPLVAFMFPQISSYFLQFYLSSFIFILENCNNYVLGILNSIIMGGLSKFCYLKLAPSKLSKHIFLGKVNSTILGGLIDKHALKKPHQSLNTP